MVKIKVIINSVSCSMVLVVLTSKISILPDVLAMVMMKLGDVKHLTKHLQKLLGLNLP